jgi:hypothetical protein
VYTNPDPVYKYGRELQKYTNAFELPPVAYQFGKHMRKNVQMSLFFLADRIYDLGDLLD